MILLMNNTNRRNECPMCETLAPTLAHLLSEHAAIKAKFDCSDASWSAIFAVEARINQLGGMHLIGTTYNED